MPNVIAIADTIGNGSNNGPEITGLYQMANSRTQPSTQKAPGVNGLFSVVPANTNKVKQITSAGFSDMAVFSDSDKVVCSGMVLSGFLIFSSASNADLMYKWDGTTFTQIMSITATFGAGYLRPSIKECVDGSGNIVWVAVCEPSSMPGQVLIARSLDKGASWTLVDTGSLFSSVFGPAGAETLWSSGQQILWGEYDSNLALGSKLYYSGDAGLTWVLAYTYTDTLHHYHWMVADPVTPNTWYVAMGDGAGCALIKLVLSGATFTGTVLNIRNNGYHSLCFLDDGTLVTGGNADYATKYNLTNNEEEINFLCGYTLNSASYKVIRNSPLSVIRQAYQDPDTGILYYGTVNYSAVDNQVGLYVSADRGQTWCCVYHTASNWGFRAVWKFQGKFYWQMANPTTTYVCSPTNARLVNALKLDTNVGNAIILDQASSFATGIANWHKYTLAGDHGPASLTWVTGGLDPGGKCMRITTNSTSKADYINMIESDYFATICGAQPTAGTSFAAVCYAKTNGMDITRYGIQFVIQKTGNTVIQEATRTYRLSGDWFKIVITGTFTTVVDNLDRLRIRVDNNTGDYTKNEVFTVDISNVQLYLSASGGVWDVDNWNNQPGQATSSESATLTKASINNNWSYLFNFNNGYVQEEPDGVICKIKAADNSYITLSYSKSSKKFTLTDGTHSVTSAHTYLGFEFDPICIAIVSNGTNTKLYLQDPLQAIETLGAASGIVMSPPTSLILGSDETNYGPGKFWGLEYFDATLTVAQVQAEFLKSRMGFN